MKGFVREIERAGILNGQVEVIFKHRSFLDYFAAFYIHENWGYVADLNEDLIVDTYFDDLWSEVAFFYIGLRREISQSLLEKIYSHADTELTADLGKLLGGRLLQAGWHSPPEQHTYGLKNAIRYAPQVREKFQEIFASMDVNIPNIFSDFIALTLSDISFNSAFLEPYTKDMLNELVASESQDDIYMAVVLSWSIRRFLKPNEVKENTDAILDKLTEFPAKEQARILLLMTLIEEDKSTRKLIGRRLNRLKKRAPKVFKALLPSKRKGFR